MTTAKNDIFIGLQPEYCYLVGEINLWWWWRRNIWWWGWWGVYSERFFQVGELANFWLVGGLPQQGKPCD